MRSLQTNQIDDWGFQYGQDLPDVRYGTFIGWARVHDEVFSTFETRNKTRQATQVFSASFVPCVVEDEG
ncbi:hypothetical protein, partial [Streptomyces sp. MAR4 CNX-425]|uniref:hypothetical protein n=1 Tax=Streptomyces sp. MAR4 CNX-425 TaxID=3406343 RepID=UPI003B5091A6